MTDGKSEVQSRSKHWVSEPLDELELKIGSEGLPALPPQTVLQVFKDRVAKSGDKIALNVKRDGKWVTWTWKKYWEDVSKCARAILSFDIKPHQGVNILGFNSPEWFIADLAAIAAGAIAAPIYSTNGPEAVHYIANHSEGVVAFVENELQLKKFLQIRDRLPHLKAIVQYLGTPPQEEGVYSWDAFLKLADKVEESELQKKIDELRPTRCCTLIYTSGTTGPPKAVMLSHDNVTWTTRITAGPTCVDIQEGDRLISYLPLSHIAAQMVDIHVPMAMGAVVYFAAPDALKGSLLETLKEVRPNVFLGVPRVWEKINEKMREVGRSVTGLKRSIADWAKSTGLQAAYADQDGKSRPWGFWLSKSLVLNKVREALGLDQARMCASAAAPIAKETLEYFFSLNIPVFEIYGMSESTGPQTVDLPGAFRIGSTGRSIVGTELKIDQPNPEGHGEICFRGRHIFMGYMKDPKATSEAIDSEGWLHSGDVGVVKDGFLYITGRIKELIITAGGENVPPVLIEDELKRELGNVIANVMVVGDRKKFLSCLFTLKTNLNANAKPGEYPLTNELPPFSIKEFGDSNIKTVEDAMKSDVVRKYLQAGVDRANKRATSNAQKIQKFEILPKDFTIEGNELTPTLKLKRRIVVQQYTEIIDKIYLADE